ncbi:hypothetical protein F4808DRAFT_474356 [Astrocystis sublimbata]|nr:hypothetical protein F4808DRAFT_474356 [Astrocystis sublimbata]
MTTSEYPVYTGVWTNWSRGPIFGATLTLSRDDANLVIALIAFFISFVATRVWRILCFIMHRVHSKSVPQEAVYYQHQAILRNTSTAEDGIWLLLPLAWANRRSKIPHLRPLSTAAVAVLCTVSFTIAGGYSSRASIAIGDEVLIQSANCGYRSSASFTQRTGAANSYFGDRIDDAARYAAQCYSNSSKSAAGTTVCDQLTLRSILAHIDTQAPCPFDDTMCRDTSNNLRIDSGLLDSHAHFGLNSPPGERVKLRSILHCAPIITEGYTSLYFNEFPDKSLDGSTLYHYGGYPFAQRKDYAYLARPLREQYAAMFSNDSTITYSNFDLQFGSVIIEDKAPSAYSIQPIESITRRDADTFILFLLGNGVLFLQPSHDPWYRVAPLGVEMSEYEPNTEASAQLFIPQEPASPLGCTAQYQFCDGAECGPLASQRDAIAGAAHLFGTTYAEFEADNATTEKAARFIHFVKSVVSPNAPYIDEILGHLGPQALLSQNNINEGWLYELEPDQWKKDLTNLWQILMAGYQSVPLDAAYGPSDPDVLGDWVGFTAPVFRKLCDNQKMRSTSYASFSLFALVFISAVGALLVVFSYVIETLFSAHGSGLDYKLLEWKTNSTLQLQRSAYEARDMGTWTRCTDVVPVTKMGEVLGGLDVEDPGHPLIC